MIVVAAACGSSGSDKSSGNPGSSDSGAAAGAPAKIVFLMEVAGESPNAVDDYYNGAKMAIDEINAAGGVLGKPLEHERFPSSVTDAQAGRAALLKAVDANPSGIIGPPFGATSYVRDWQAVKVPVIGASTEPQLAYGQSAGSEWVFNQEPTPAALPKFGVEFAKNKLDAKTIGLLDTDENFGRTSGAAVKAEAKSAGVEINPERYVPTSVTDLTSQLLEMKDADAIMAFAFPNVVGLTLRQLAQNKMDTPVISGAGDLLVYNKLVSPSVLGNYYSLTPCDPSPNSTRKPARDFAVAYNKRYGHLPSAKSALTHDSVWLMAKAMEKAGTTTDHAKIRDALGELTWTGGACQSKYHADGSHWLSHQVQVVQFKDGTPSVVTTYDVKPKAKGEK